MGTVHGVWLKYVAISGISYLGYSMFMKDDVGSKITLLDILGHGVRRLASPPDGRGDVISLWRAIPALLLGYSSILNGVIAALFKLEIGMSILGKDRQLGTIPEWSYVVFFPFHIPTILYTNIHSLIGTHIVEKDGKMVRERVPVATEVQPGWWVGGCHSHELKKEWAAVIDLTVEFPESCINNTQAYFSIPTWDGVPGSPEELEEAATFALGASQQGGDILIHCAHGRGRSTTVMCACLVKSGLFKTWEDAFEQGIKPQRSVCKLNSRMKENLTKWQEIYVDQKKGQ
mmetsp:Transcript_1922/g.2687  ORF Transcript_1922/g.2687 Transcript_1922/m.2687 type:complete len:288 (-) Transcript_1922:59-922(-)|eukprot:CAMPEP_0198153700 /NCGR_PEP_ID=MMETSP1443-20131203/65309_1 /TAXON_ID=186043 /ORGANISM="Entomoneis sp., Strain CCMP2396" /LENGTH=287 /DNA_ID=CAMNT_0043820125 /DNA_START=188 /DNA_END=1051 /DNA_ORIENTATION=+